MKKTLVLSLICLAIAIASFIAPPNKLTGRRQTKFSDGSTVVASFGKDDTYNVSVNGKAFVNGRYYVRRDTVGVEDPSCGAGYYGTYLMDFFSKDSVRFALVQDTCSGRRGETVQMKFGRVKSAKP